MANWISYNDLAWTEELLVSSSDYEEEVMVYIDLMNRCSTEPPVTLLHLGSGAGWQDRIFKRQFSVTGIDISPGMLNEARAFPVALLRG